jgi:hypothetical protein
MLLWCDLNLLRALLSCFRVPLILGTFLLCFLYAYRITTHAEVVNAGYMHICTFIHIKGEIMKEPKIYWCRRSSYWSVEDDNLLLQTVRGQNSTK